MFHCRPSEASIETGINRGEVIGFLKLHRSLEHAWDLCERSDWMLWTLESAWQLGRIPNDSDASLRLFACWCARACLKVLKVHPATVRVVDSAEAFARGRSSAQDVALAREGASGGGAGAARALSRHIPGASAQLCCFATSEHIAINAARQASRHHISAVIDLALETGAEKLKWTSGADALSQVLQAELEALKLATLAGQAHALREIVGNPFEGKQALKRRPRDETGVPLLPDIASSVPDELYDIPVSETPLSQPSNNLEAEVERISNLLLERYKQRVEEDGVEAYTDFKAAKRALLQASDFDPALDSVSIRAYELAEIHLFGHVMTSGVLQ